MSPSKILLFSSLSFIFGIFLSSFFKFNLFVLFLTPLFLFFLLIYFLITRDKRILFSCLFFILFSLGSLYYQYQIFKLEKAKNLLFEKENAKILGILTSPPQKREKFQNLILKIQTLNQSKYQYSGKVLIKTSLSQDFQFGEQLEISGRISEPKETKGFNYKDYLLKDKILAIFYFPKIKKTGKNFASSISKFILSLKEKIKENIEKIFPIPHSGLIEALLFGEEEKIPEDLKEKLNITNTRHIAAVSGMNVTLLSLLILNFLLTLGLWRQQAFYLTLILIFIYLFMIGFPASAIRASIMGILFLIAQYFGRISTSQRAVYFTLAIMLLFNPLLLKYDISFQLSFLATLGLVYLYPVFLEIFKDAPKTLGFRENLSATLAAQFFVLPLLLYNFGKFSPIFIFPNILILPILPLTTILGFLSSFLAIIYFPLGKFLSYSALFFTNYILKVVEFFSQFPVLSFEKLSLSFLIFFYLLLGLFTFFLNKKFSQPYFLR